MSFVRLYIQCKLLSDPSVFRNLCGYGLYRLVQVMGQSSFAIITMPFHRYEDQDEENNQAANGYNQLKHFLCKHQIGFIELNQSLSTAINELGYERKGILKSAFFVPVSQDSTLEHICNRMGALVLMYGSDGDYQLSETGAVALKSIPAESSIGSLIDIAYSDGERKCIGMLADHGTIKDSDIYLWNPTDHITTAYGYYQYKSTLTIKVHRQGFYPLRDMSVPASYLSAYIPYYVDNEQGRE